jgi:hypothetical protein
MVGVKDTYEQRSKLPFERDWDEEFVGVLHGTDELTMVGLLFFQCDKLFECSVGKHDGKSFVVCCLKAFVAVVFCRLKCEIGVVFWKQTTFDWSFVSFVGMVWLCV